MLAALLLIPPASSGYRRLVTYIMDECATEEPEKFNEAPCEPPIVEIPRIYQDIVTGADVDGLEARAQANEDRLDRLIEEFLTRQEGVTRRRSFSKKIIRRIKAAGVTAEDEEIERALAKLKAARIIDEEEAIAMILMALT
ncbi:hypothetical protein LCGC14_0355380 [marine sediment metagenome]|uniref:Uncharacterized protein n=1 Tax=marine sediment metagenome TaxID=412755 RepID=A0A0F9WHV0_9ZZZZ